MDRDAVVLVLAAGRGTRMGTPKALMSVLGAPWWKRQHDAIARAGLASLWVVSEFVLRATGGEIARLARAVGAPDDAPMFESFRAGVDALRGDPPAGVLVLPVDVPMSGAGVAGALRAAGAVAAPTYLGSNGHPLWLEWNWLCAALSADRSARLDVLTSAHRVLVEVDDPFVAMNLNRAGDVEMLERALRERSA